MDIKLITPFDIVYSIILFFIILGYANSIKQKNIGNKPYYKNFTKGLIVKLFGGILFCLIYALYYNGGDTVNYYLGVHAMWSVFLDSPIAYVKILLEDNPSVIWNIFSNVQEYPPAYMVRDMRTFNVIKFSSLIGLSGLGGFLSTTILVSYFTYRWVWKLYSFLVEKYSNSLRKINWCILFLPSTIFWGSGIMKDTYTFAATCYAVYGLQQFFIQRKRINSTIIQLILAFYLIFTIKPYIAFALLPGLIIYANFERVKRIRSIFIKIFALLIFLIIGSLFLNTLFIDFDEMFGKYSADRILEEAAIQNADLQRDVYGSNSFDIGEVEPTLKGAISKFFPAINAALFRPFIWEAGGSPTMIFSGLETTLILILAMRTLLKGPVRFIRNTVSDPFLLFCLLFTLILGFGVGLSTSNFGALVRYKIPYLPFFILLLLLSHKKRVKS